MARPTRRPSTGESTWEEERCVDEPEGIIKPYANLSVLFSDGKESRNEAASRFMALWHGFSRIAENMPEPCDIVQSPRARKAS